ncbi:membrane fusion protein (multidrug efflux system) [Neorhizobium sp. R1-B]|uniref:HlyD family secretion protein n=1 Tax=Neorhizobium TaxID=1525371 RepID=UPI000CF99CE9|nr:MULTISPECIES: HlyD family secretion protein [Neorhizobium]TCV73444.1 membrane fusion protein (multidrug efflux system) [Neorhizobium sp. S3-V5DH]TDX85820.1 membrane fusion protein (multidrug efflux system) [Neorhizobium sp. R1-B]
MTASQNGGALRAVTTDNIGTSEAEARNERPTTEQPAAEAIAAPAAAKAPEKKKRRGFLLPVIALALLGGAGWYGYNWWTDGRFLVSTDDAYVEGNLAVISPKVSGYVAKVNVVENQSVKAGDPLVTLDDGDYKLALQKAEAAIESANLAISRIDAQIVGGRAALEQSKAQQGALEAAVRGAEITQKRASELAAKSVGTTADLDNAKIALEQARANLVAGQAAVASAEANIGLLQAQRKEAVNTVRTQELARDQAARDLSFTVLKAPYDGVIGNLAVQTGDLVSAGKRLASLVPLTELYIEANFKETQIGHLEPGSKVRVHVDAYEDQPIVGTVESIAPASGAVFSMLPPENATGNFTKVVQRVPVRISIPKEDLEREHLRAGLSVVVDVDTRTAPDNTTVAAAK